MTELVHHPTHRFRRGKVVVALVHPRNIQRRRPLKRRTRVAKPDFQHTVHHQSERGRFRPSLGWRRFDSGVWKTERFGWPSLDVFKPIAAHAVECSVQIVSGTFDVLYQSQRRQRLGLGGFQFLEVGGQSPCPLLGRLGLNRIKAIGMVVHAEAVESILTKRRIGEKSTRIEGRLERL